ncbi:MAG: molybdenum cofactor guanylyltransferase [Thaumarchaeota archaeon]|nr:molybdenum cofactor guanylyltransferase [Nitrososphaerota archaeon]
MSFRKAGGSGSGKPSTLGVIVLAGGKSSRLRVNKVFLKIRCEPLISEVIRVASDVTESIVLAIGSRDDEEEFAAILSGRVKIVKDTVEEKAALYGVFTGLQAVETDFAAVLAADLPFVNSEVIRILNYEAQGFDLAIPKWPNGDIEPLYAVYRVAASRRAFGDAIGAGGVRIRDAIDRLEKVNYVPVNRFLQVDNSLRCFININTAADLEKVRTILREEPNESGRTVR